MSSLVTTQPGAIGQVAFSASHNDLVDVSPREIERLSLLLSHTKQGVWVFCIYNVILVRDAIVEHLRERLSLPIYEFTLSNEHPNPRDYLKSIPPEAANQRAVIIFYDAWSAFDAGFLDYLDLQREQFWRAPHSFVFWIRDADRALLARYAPNFFSRHSGVFDFQVTIPLQAETLSSLPVPWDSIEERQRLERLYSALLEEYKADREPNYEAMADLLEKKASIWYYSARLEDAQDALKLRLNIANEIESQQIKADSNLQLGRIYYIQDSLLAAAESYRAALINFQAIGDRLGQANTCKALGDLALRQADFSAAADAYHAALSNFQAIGARMGLANTRKALGDLALRQAELPAAAEAYRTALADFQAIGDRLGQANTRKALGDLALRQAELPAAAETYHTALADFQAIGDRLGQANTRKALGDLALRQAELPAAAQAYRAALADYQAIGSRLGQANTINSMGELAEAQDQWQTAHEHYTAALQLYRAIGDPYAAVTARSLARVEARLAGQHGDP